MMKEKIKIVENEIYIDIEQLRKIITSEWQSGKIYKANYGQGIRGIVHPFVKTNFKQN